MDKSFDLCYDLDDARLLWTVRYLVEFKIKGDYHNTKNNPGNFCDE
jgi:hypothetical protein